jgi:hypothetical protein
LGRAWNVIEGTEVDVSKAFAIECWTGWKLVPTALDAELVFKLQ